MRHTCELTALTRHSLGRHPEPSSGRQNSQKASRSGVHSHSLLHCTWLPSTALTCQMQLKPCSA